MAGWWVLRGVEGGEGWGGGGVEGLQSSSSAAIFNTPPLSSESAAGMSWDLSAAGAGEGGGGY